MFPFPKGRRRAVRGGGIKHNSTRHELQSTLGDTLRRRDFDRSER